jgi:transposase
VNGGRHQIRMPGRLALEFAVVNFARTLMIDIQAVRNAVIERWNNGQTERQINRLNTFRRAMFGRADTELLGAGLLPISDITDHRVCE